MEPLKIKARLTLLVLRVVVVVSYSKIEHRNVRPQACKLDKGYWKQTQAVNLIEISYLLISSKTFLT